MMILFEQNINNVILFEQTAAQIKPKIPVRVGNKGFLAIKARALSNADKIGVLFEQNSISVILIACQQAGNPLFFAHSRQISDFLVRGVSCLFFLPPTPPI